MQSDTVVGIVGAVVLVAVMIGVFAYEYNNAPVDEPEDLDAAQRTEFNETYLDLDSEGDIDGDGTPNYADYDIDGDGIPNANDTDIKTYHPVSGSVGLSSAAAPTSFSSAFHAEEGLIHVQLELTSAAAVSGQSLLALSVSVTGSDGLDYPATAAVNGDTITYSVDIQDVGGGTFTVNVANSSPVGLATDFNGELTFHYAD